MRYTKPAAILLSVALMSGCELSSDLGDGGAKTGQISFSDELLPVLERKCTSCHGASVRPQPAAGLSLNSWELLLQGSSHGEVVIPFDSDRSLLVRLSSERRGNAHPGELGGDTLTLAELSDMREWIDAGAPSDAGLVPFADATNLLYVCNQDDATISVIDMDRNVVARLIDLRDFGFAGTAKPHHVAVEPDGSAWYVSLIGANVVAKFDRQNMLVGQFTFETPGLLALDPASDLLYVGRSLSAPNPPSSIGRVDRREMTIEEIPVVFSRPHALALNSSGTHVYTGSLGVNQLIAVRTADTDVSFVPVAGPLHAFVQHAVSPDGTRMATTAQLTHRIIFFDLTDPSSPDELWWVGTNDAPWHPAFSRDGNWLFAGNKDANTVSVVSVVGRRVEDIITGLGLAQPHGSYVSRDGRTLYISNRNTNGAYVPRHDLVDNAMTGTIAVIDIGSRDIIKVIEVGRFAAGINARAQ